MLPDVLRFLPSAGSSATILAILVVLYRVLMAIPWLLAAMIAILTRDKERSKQSLKVLQLLRRPSPWWWPRGPKERQ